MLTWNKPAGLPVFPPHERPDGACVLADVLRAQPFRAEVAWPAGFEGGIAHRLDNATSGALWIADDVEELGRIREDFEQRRILKWYVLEAAKDVPWDSHRVDLPIAHDPRKKGRCVVPRGKATPHRGEWREAETEFERVGERIFVARMRTGVMHQIRVHAAAVGLALRGDRIYGGGGPIAEEVPFRLHHLGAVGMGEGVALPGWAIDVREALKGLAAPL